jgi:hypothetical protein
MIIQPLAFRKQASYKESGLVILSQLATCNGFQPCLEWATLFGSKPTNIENVKERRIGILLLKAPYLTMISRPFTLPELKKVNESTGT